MKTEASLTYIMANLLAILTPIYYIWLIFYLQEMYSLEPTPEEISKALAKRHKLLRKKLGLTQKEMADRSGVSMGSLKRFENTGKISLETLLKLAYLSGRLKDFDTIFQIGDDINKIEKLFTNK